MNKKFGEIISLIYFCKRNRLSYLV